MLLPIESFSKTLSEIRAGCLHAGYDTVVGVTWHTKEEHVCYDNLLCTYSVTNRDSLERFYVELWGTTEDNGRCSLHVISYTGDTRYPLYQGDMSSLQGMVSDACVRVFNTSPLKHGHVAFTANLRGIADALHKINFVHTRCTDRTIEVYLDSANFYTYRNYYNAGIFPESLDIFMGNANGSSGFNALQYSVVNLYVRDINPRNEVTTHSLSIRINRHRDLSSIRMSHVSVENQGNPAAAIAFQRVDLDKFIEVYAQVMGVTL